MVDVAATARAADSRYFGANGSVPMTHLRALERSMRADRRARLRFIALLDRLLSVKQTRYFAYVRKRPDRVVIQDAWVLRAVLAPVRESVQTDGRIRRWCRVPEYGDRYLRVVLLPDGETIHNAFFDRSFVP